VCRLAPVLVVVGFAASCTQSESPVEPRSHLPAAALATADPPGYQAIDLGTLGGRNTVPAALNDRAQVTGYSESSDRVSHAFLWEDSVMHDLRIAPTGSGDPGSATSAGEAINRFGEIAGTRFSDELSQVEVFVWDTLTPAPIRTGLFRDLDDGGIRLNPGTRVIGVTDGGDVLATEFSDFFGNRAVLWNQGTRQVLPGLNPDGESIPWAMNAAGQGAGSSYLYPRGSPYAGYYFHPVLWDGGRVIDLGVLAPRACPTPGPTACGVGVATALSDAPVVVGWTLHSAYLVRAFRWHADTLSDLGAFPGLPTIAYAVNDRGQVAGNWNFSPPGGGFLWEDGVTTDLGSLGGGMTRVKAINEAGEIVGSSLAAGGGQHAFVWRDGQMLDLGVGPLPNQAAIAIAINSHGDVLGIAGNCQKYYDTTCGIVSPTRGVLWRRLTPASAAVAGRGRGP
jgi:probable HAF family extracellular repeat protein